MSFLLDPPALVLLGALVYVIAKKIHLKKLWVAILGIAITGIFIGVSVLLYLDIIRWYIPFVIDMKGSEWMFHSNITGIYKKDVPTIIVVIMFGLYPFWHKVGYIIGKYISKPHLDKTVYTYNDVKSRTKLRTEAFSIKRGKDFRKLLRECLSELGGIQTFVERGDNVLIKTNISGGNPYRPGSFTSILVTDELSRLVLEAGGTPTIVDADMIWTQFWPVAIEEGYKKWAKESHMDLVNLSETELAFFEFGGILQKRIISKKVLNADVIISLSAMKTHILTGVTLCMKNMYGTLPQIDKAIYHKLGIEEVIFEVNKAFPPNLAIIDGTIGGEAIGPLSSKPVNFETLIASGNVVVADALACTLMGFNPLDIKHIKYAHEAGLGNAEVELCPLPPHEKDGKWIRPSTDVAQFYTDIFETLLKYPGVEPFFNVLADFMLYDMATLPIFRDVTPEFLLVLNDIFDSLKRSRKI
ncbi:MAG: DUF362 domain-containing protein [Theionarchaea archaeon]|nr:DUF362 domain-containing protein [Theionarchaea archaeon]